MKYGGKLVLGFSMFFGSIATILSAPMATISYKGLVFFRFLTGLSHVIQMFDFLKKRREKFFIFSNLLVR